MAAGSLPIGSLAIGSLRTSFSDRFRFDAGIRLVARNDLLFDFGLQQTLDIKEQPVLVDTDKRDSVSFLPCPCSSANAMHIVFRNVRQLIVDNMR